MASAIELYQKAYDLDYRKGDWETAEEIYRKIVERFPHAEEKEYAAVHLERIDKLKGNPDEYPLAPVGTGPGGSGALAVVAFVLCILLGAGCAILGYMTWQQRQQATYTQLLLDGTMSQKVGAVKEAAVSFKRAQALIPYKSAAYRYLAELRLDQKQLNLAEKDLERWKRVRPGDAYLKSFKERFYRAKAEAEGGSGR